MPEEKCSSWTGQCERSDLYLEFSMSISADGLHRRPGILVLINDADWELEGEDRYELKKNDNILFVSTLHGG